MDTATIVIRSQSSSDNCYIFVDSEEIGALPPKGSLRASVDPGSHIIETYFKTTDDQLKMNERWKITLRPRQMARLRMKRILGPALYPDGHRDFGWEMLSLGDPLEVALGEAQQI